MHNKTTSTVLYVLLWVAVIVIADVLVFRHAFWGRLIANIGFVLMFVGFYFKFLNRP